MCPFTTNKDGKRAKQKTELGRATPPISAKLGLLDSFCLFSAVWNQAGIAYSRLSGCQPGTALTESSCFITLTEIQLQMDNPPFQYSFGWCCSAPQ